MSQLKVTRKVFSPTSTIGELQLDSEFFCYTLEPRKDLSRGKPFAIPVGLYRLSIRWSPRFSAPMPHVEDVSGFDGILIHYGNYPGDTEGCVLVGKDYTPKFPDFIGRSKLAFKELFDKLTPGEIQIAEDSPIATG